VGSDPEPGNSLLAFGLGGKDFSVVLAGLEAAFDLGDLAVAFVLEEEPCDSWVAFCFGGTQASVALVVAFDLEALAVGAAFDQESCNSLVETQVSVALVVAFVLVGLGVAFVLAGLGAAPALADPVEALVPEACSSLGAASVLTGLGDSSVLVEEPCSSLAAGSLAGY
jgi:hypothetical protein